MNRNKNVNADNISASNVHLGDKIVVVNSDNSPEVSEVCAKNINKGIINAIEVHIGDRIYNINLCKYKDYNNKLNELRQLEKLFEDCQDEQEQFKLSYKISEKTEIIESIKQSVLHLAKTINEIKINTKRLILAKQYFVKSQFDKAREILDDKLLSKERVQLLAEKEKREIEQRQFNSKLLNNSNEFLLLAELTAFDYRNKDWFNKTVVYYTSSLELNKNVINLFSYASFLRNHNEIKEAINVFNECLTHLTVSDLEKQATIINNLGDLYSSNNYYDGARKLYNEVLDIRRRLVDKYNNYKSDLARTLNNLGLLCSSNHDFEDAEKFYTEALAIRRELASKKPDSYKSYVADTLNNLGLLYSSNNNKYEEAKKFYDEALEIDRSIAKKNPDNHKPYLAIILSNLGLLHGSNNDFEVARDFHNEALEIGKDIAKKNPYAYKPLLARILNNLGLLYSNNNDYKKARICYNDSIKIKQDFAKKNPDTYKPDLAHTLNNLAILYIKSTENDSALKTINNSINILNSCLKTPFVENLIEKAYQIERDLKDNNLSKYRCASNQITTYVNVASMK